jgi:hypothetical protein
VPGMIETSGSQRDSFEPSLVFSVTMSASDKPKQDAGPVDAELEKLLSREASAFQREVEVDRILKAFKLKSVSLTTNLNRLLTIYFACPVLMIS